MKSLAAALLAGVALATGLPASAASFPVFMLTGGEQIPPKVAYSVSSDSLNYVAKTVNISNDGSNNINRVLLTISASTGALVKDFSSCAPPCTSASKSSDGKSVTYFFDVFPPSGSVDVVVVFPTPLSGSMQVLGAVRINNTSNNSSQLVAKLPSSPSDHSADIQFGADAADVLGYLPKNGGQVTALKAGVLKTTVTFPPNTVSSPIGSVRQDTNEPNSCSSLYKNNQCIATEAHLPATGIPAVFGGVLQMVFDLDAAAISGPSAKIENVVLQYQKQDWVCTTTSSGTTCQFQFVGDPLLIQPCESNGAIPLLTPTGYAPGRCFLPPQDMTFKMKGVLQGFWRFITNSHDNGWTLLR